MAEANSYEEQRRRQIEANKRKLHELGVHELSAAVCPAAAKPMPAKLPIPRNPRLGNPIRRSTRIASLPDYREERAYAITKAQELKDQLGSDNPTFIKPLSHDYATKSSHLYIPVQFRQYLPVQDEEMLLVDEMNKEFDVLYNHGKNPRLRRWRRFAAEHKLANGDCVPADREHKVQGLYS